MRLWELFEDISKQDIAAIEKMLDARVYQPAEWLKTKDKRVLDLELPTNNAHFIERIKCRDKDPQNITPQEIARLLAKARLDPKIGTAEKLNQLAGMEHPEITVTIQDPDTNLVIPLIVKANPSCETLSKINPSVGYTRNGDMVPRNKAYAKTIFRKGVPDPEGCGTASKPPHSGDTNNYRSAKFTR